MSKKNWLARGLGSLGVLCQTLPGWTTPIPNHDSVVEPAELSEVVPLDERPSLDCPFIPPQVQPESLQVQPDRLESDCIEPANDAMAQVQSVAALSDVRPTDWAYQALQSLAERYDVAIGYPNGTFRGNQALTRNEFAAGLARVLDVISQQYVVGRGNVAQLREDLATVQQLQASYGVIATDLRERANQLDQQVTILEQNQFSTTTKLSGQSVLVFTDGSNARGTVLSRTRLNLITSFAPNGALSTQLEAGNNGNDAIGRAQEREQNLLGTLGLLAGGGGLDYVGVASAVRLSNLSYSFQPAPGFNLTVGARLSPRDFIDYNRFANDSTETFSSSFFLNNPLIVQNQIDRVGGAGAVLTWKPANLPLIVRALYVAADASRPNADITDGGLFGDRNQGSLEVEYDFSKNIIARFQLTKATVNNVDIFAGGINAEWAFNRQFAVFGRFAIGSYEGFNPLLNQDLDLNPKSWSIGFVARQLFIPGSTAGIAIGQPFVEKDLGDATQTNIEVFYSFLLNDNISVTPALTVVSNPDNRDRGTIFQWFLRLVYSF
ncbi:iron uptake porin [Leptolyngbya sp. FACHB-321]|uniref:iron uptake porin n=1 Tax=Leptolyngbya sp. FACHB-321 TaxID=2692807 RepID=UPI0018EF9F98